MPMESKDLRKAGLKVTQPRMRILELLENASPRHMTAEDIYRLLLDNNDDIGLATVYRVLTQFEAAGLVIKHNFEGGQAVRGRSGRIRVGSRQAPRSHGRCRYRQGDRVRQ